MSDEGKIYFSNSKEELEYYKKTYKLNVEELSSCKSKIKVLENINNKLKEKITQAFSSTTENNDTSKVIFTPNEFKKLWESIIQTELIDSFDFCIKEYKLISNLCQDILLLVYEETKKIIDLKFLEILKCLNLSKTSKDKKENLYAKILPFFRENFNNTFELDEEKIKNIKEKLKTIINQYNFLNEIKNTSTSSKNLIDVQMNNNDKNSIINNRNSSSSDMHKILENKIRGKNFDGIMKSFFNICLYMILHDPVLNFDIEKYSQRKLMYYFFNKKDFINVEGFGNEKTPCVIILPPPLLKKKYQFNGLRPAVYILSDISINSEIFKQCKINEKKKEEENRINKLKENNNEEKKHINHSNSNENDNKLKKSSNVNKNILNSKNVNDNNNSIIKNNIKNINEYNNNIKNNYIKITNISSKEGNQKENYCINNEYYYSYISSSFCNTQLFKNYTNRFTYYINTIFSSAYSYCLW